MYIRITSVNTTRNTFVQNISWSISGSRWTQICPAYANSVDKDQLAFEEANWSGSALFVIKFVNLYQQSGSGNQIGWKLEVGVASLFIQHGNG